MTTKITVEIWSDLVCPWCYVGKRRFERALDQFEHREDVDVRWRSFELDPTAPSDDAMTIPERMQTVLGMSTRDTAEGIAYISGLAAEVDLDYHLDKARPVNSRDAHRLLHFAATFGHDDTLRERLSNGYTTEGMSLADHATLTRVAEEVGLDPTAAAEVLAGHAYLSEVLADEEEAGRVGVRGVPAFLFDRTYLTSGARSVAELHVALARAWSSSRGR